MARRRHRDFALGLFFVGAALLPARSAVADDPAPSLEKVAGARDKAIAYLSTRQWKDGSFGAAGGNEVYGGAKGGKPYTQPFGPTALALWALLASGVAKDDDRVKRGFAYLESVPRTVEAQMGPSAYEVSAMLLAVTAKAKVSPGWRQGEISKLDAEDKKKAQGFVDALLKMRATAKTLGWRYNIRTGGKAPGGDTDLSSTGLAALALFAAERCGIKVASDVWADLAAYAMSQQDPRGPEAERVVSLAGDPPAGDDGGKPPKDHVRGFAYIRSDSLEPDEGKATGGMTACGIATVEMARQVLLRRKAKGWAAKDPEARQSTYDGCAWLDANWSSRKNPRKDRTNLYHLLYLVHASDALDLLGAARLGSHDWHEEIQGDLLGLQEESGKWDTKSTHDPSDVLDTCFALLFLARPFTSAPSTAVAPRK